MVSGGGGISSAKSVLWFFVTAPHLFSLACLGLCLARPAAAASAAQDVRTDDILHGKIIQDDLDDFQRFKRWLETGRTVLEDDATDGSGSTFEENFSKDLNGEGDLRRLKRKVISRGGHYMIRSSSGNSPWSSTSYDSYSTYRTSKPRGYGYNPRGRIGDSGIRTTTFGEIIRSKPAQRSPRKKIARTFKGEIAQYAMLHGPRKAAMHYEKRVGRRLKERIILKFVQRYKDRVKKNKKKARS
ncbi:uncharacterized protein [Palaemon carinicauda]|uniref:uncharacterized protein n=1 Tax=Palaemon carinicauda TaxID=392227 RepID=UPI0035B59E10